MESHILNMYHQAAYRSIGHKIMRSTSESLSSESSCNQNSPEYAQSQQVNQYEEESNEEWDHQDSHRQVWSQNQNVNITQSNQDTSIDEDENIEVQEVSLDDRISESNDHNDLLEAESIEENSLVEGDDYDVIQVFAVDPNLDLEASSDEDQEDYCIKDNESDSDEGEYYTPECTTNGKHHSTEIQTHNVCQESLGINFDAPVVSNVDEYFIKDTVTEKKNILAVKDEPVVKDVDEYFIKKTKEDIPSTNVDIFFKKDKVPEKTDFRISKTVPDEIFANDNSNEGNEYKEGEIEAANENTVGEVSINESDLEVLPNIEDLKRYLLDDLPYTKLKNAKTYSVSLPHSPMHNICMDIDAKTCLSFEDLNLDLSDLTFENDKEKSGTSIKSDDIPRTLTEEDVNSFLITSKSEPKTVVKDEDDLSTQDMDIDRPVDSLIENVDESAIKVPNRKCTSTPIPTPNVLEFCIEKTTVKKEPDIKAEPDDFVDVESCNDTVIPVLEANNLNSLLEQFEATEKLNNKTRKPVITVSEPKTKSYSLTSGMRLQDAGVQLNKTKMRQILMPTTVNTVIRRSPSPVHSDHDYCSSKKRHSLPNLKGGQSLLKPEVLSSNSRILNSRHRSCKNKKIVYHLSSDDESDVSEAKKNKTMNNRASDDSDIKTKKNNVKLSVKSPVNNHRKKISPSRSLSNDSGIDKSNDSVIVKNACKASDTPSSQNSNGSIKLTIKNKSEVIIKNCDVKDNHKDIVIEKPKLLSDPSSKSKLANNMNSTKCLEPVDRNKNKDLISVDTYADVNVKQEVNSKPEQFYAALFSNKHDMQVPLSRNLKLEKKSIDEDTKIVTHTPVSEVEQPQKKKKLNLQQYKLRRDGNSNSSSAQVSPEAIFPDMPSNLNLDKDHKIVNQHFPNVSHPKEQQNVETPEIIFDPIREASRKILMNSKKQKAEAMRKRDEDIVMSKIPKVENLELQPLISDAEMMKIVGMTPTVLPVPIVTPPISHEEKIEAKEKLNDYDEIVLVSIGTNTDEHMFKKLEFKSVESKKRKSESPLTENKSTINFKIKKSEHVSKHNVFDSVKSNRCSVDDKKHSDIKMDKERLKDITATLKSVEKQVDTKISSNSLFASIQDIVMKKAPASIATVSNAEHKQMKPISPVEKRDVFKYVKTSIIRDYDTKAEHGEDKVILHLEKSRKKPNNAVIEVQTDATPEFSDLGKVSEKTNVKEKSPSPRKRNDSDMSMSSEDSPVRTKKVQNISTLKSDEKVVKPRSESRRQLNRSQSKEKRSRSRDRYDVKYRRSRSHSRGHRRKRSPSRNRSRSRGRYRRYRRSDSPYRRKRRSRTRSPYRSSRRSPSVRRDYRSNRSRSRSKHLEPKSRSPVLKKKLSPQINVNSEKKTVKSLTPPLRKLTVSESSETSTSSSSTSTSSKSSVSCKSRKSCSPNHKDESFKKKAYGTSVSSEDRESNTPVEERRIVFVGRLEKDVTKAGLRSQFVKFGPVAEVRLHSKEDGSRYGFVTFKRPRDAWSAVEAASTFPQYDVGFGGRRAFCRQSYADLDGLEAKYTESAFHGQQALPARRNDDMSFEQMLLDIKNKLNKRKGDKNRDDTA